jgi:hypothetical protein
MIFSMVMAAMVMLVFRERCLIGVLVAIVADLSH